MSEHLIEIREAEGEQGTPCTAFCLTCNWMAATRRGSKRSARRRCTNVGSALRGSSRQVDAALVAGLIGLAHPGKQGQEDFPNKVFFCLWLCVRQLNRFLVRQPFDLLTYAAHFGDR